MADQHPGHSSGTMITSWLVVTGISVFFFGWGLLIYFTVGVKWPPHWYYGSMEEVPGVSVHSTQRSRSFFGSGPGIPQTVLPRRQHIMGRDTAPEVIPGREESPVKEPAGEAVDEPPPTTVNPAGETTDESSRIPVNEEGDHL